MSDAPCFQCRTDAVSQQARPRVFCCNECRDAAAGKARCATCGGKCSSDVIPTMGHNGKRNSYCSTRCFQHAIAMMCER